MDNDMLLRDPMHDHRCCVTLLGYHGPYWHDALRVYITSTIRYAWQIIYSRMWCTLCSVFIACIKCAHSWCWQDPHATVQTHFSLFTWKCSRYWYDAKSWVRRIIRTRGEICHELSEYIKKRENTLKATSTFVLKVHTIVHVLYLLRHSYIS